MGYRSVMFGYDVWIWPSSFPARNWTAMHIAYLALWDSQSQHSIWSIWATRGASHVMTEINAGPIELIYNSTSRLAERFLWLLLFIVVVAVCCCCHRRCCCCCCCCCRCCFCRYCCCRCCCCRRRVVLLLLLLLLLFLVLNVLTASLLCFRLC